MNKQEAIERVNELTTTVSLKGSGIQVLIDQQAVLEVIDQIHEPQKQVVPKFVAEWIEENKIIYNLYGLMGHIKDSLAPSEIMKWFSTNPTLTGEILARAWLDSYEVEKEKLYTVEIPNPVITDNSDSVTVLMKTDLGVVLTDVVNYIGRKQESAYQLTESEIKQDFEWAFRWAKEVEDK